MTNPIDLILAFIGVFILGNVAARIDLNREKKNCDSHILNIYYAALLGACFKQDQENFMQLAENYIKSSRKVLEEGKNE